VDAVLIRFTEEVAVHGKTEGTKLGLVESITFGIIEGKPEGVAL